MEWLLPVQKLEIGNVNIGSPWARESRKEYEQKPMAPLSYFGTQFRIPFVSVLFPPLGVVEYNPVTGKLVMDMAGNNLTCIKLGALQDTLLGAICYHQAAWFKSEFSKEDVKGGFQPLYSDNRLHLFCPHTARFFKDGQWNTSCDIVAGCKIRVAVKLHGISFLTRPDGSWSGRCRFQHRILGIIMQGEEGTASAQQQQHLVGTSAD
jgi:hypothetical protein